jgi:hypothetical protein
MSTTSYLQLDHPHLVFFSFFFHFFSSIFFPTVFPVGENKGKKTAAGRKNSQQKKNRKTTMWKYILSIFIF